MKTIQRVVDDPEACERFDLSALVTDVVADLRETSPDATITTDLPSSVAVTVHPDFPAAIREVIDNAIGHHDGDRPEVEVAVRRRSGGGTELVVTDDGPGIPGGQRDLVLGDTEVTQLQHGNGLGLWLVKWVLEASDGELTIEDTAEGTTVRFRLPPAE
jgi:signal transduction histidine kinase